MKISHGPRGSLIIDDARIIFRNFAGAQTQYNRKGDRNFALVIDSKENADMLVAEGWNIKVKPPRNEDEDGLMFMPIKINFDSNRPPRVYLKSGNNPLVELLPSDDPREDMVATLDNIDIFSVDLDIHPYDWNVNGKMGRSAYLDGITVHQQVDRFRARYED